MYEGVKMTILFILLGLTLGALCVSMYADNKSYEKKLEKQREKYKVYKNIRK